MKLYPIKDCMRRADELIERANAVVFQQWLCAHCGAKQTMDVPNGFFIGGICEKCGKETDIAKDGCNYMVTIGVPVSSVIDQ